tara:strand:+ start:432 stop:1076 length:645 start_codon:yes stop_codon:yes gene_type:complete
MKVLIACEESQATCIEFRKLGHEAYSCDVQECSGGYKEWHIKGDAIKEAYSGKYDLMVAHPPCTYLSNAGSRWLFKKGKLNNERYNLGLEAKAFFMKLYNAPIKYKAIENPTPIKIFKLPKHSQAVQPYEYGHPYSKRTLLWLVNLPLLQPTKIVREYEPYLPSNTGLGRRLGRKFKFVSINKIDSSKTFKGISQAMAKQWSNPNNYLLQKKLF